MKHKCPIAFPSNPELQGAFQRMYDTETVLDDMDYATYSPRLQVAMKAAEDFNALLDKAEGGTQ